MCLVSGPSIVKMPIWVQEIKSKLRDGPVFTAHWVRIQFSFKRPIIFPLYLVIKPVVGNLYKFLSSIVGLCVKYGFTKLDSIEYNKKTFDLSYLLLLPTSCKIC